MTTNEAGMLAHIDDLENHIANLHEAAQAVIDAWEDGDLAGAINWLDSLLPEKEGNRHAR